MAITKIHAIKETLGKAIDYIVDKEKTDDTLLVSSFGCVPEMAALEFYITKEQMGKLGGNLGYHIIQSFTEDEVSPETAHQLATRMADEFLQGEYEYVVATHIDKEHIHNHVIFNSINFETGNKFRNTFGAYKSIRSISDKLCQEYGLSVIEKPQGKGKNYQTHTGVKNRQSFRSRIAIAIDKCVLTSENYDDFLKQMEARGFEHKSGKFLAFRDVKSGQEKFTRIDRRLGNRYSIEGITERIEQSQLLDSFERDKMLAALEKSPSTPPKKKEKTMVDGIRQIEIDTERLHKINQLVNIDSNQKAKANKGYAFALKKINLKEKAKTLNFMTENHLSSYSDVLNRMNEVRARYNDSSDKIHEIQSEIETKKQIILYIRQHAKTNNVYLASLRTKSKAHFYLEHENELALHEKAEDALRKLSNGEQIKTIKEYRAEIQQLEERIKDLRAIQKDCKAKNDELSVVKSNLEMMGDGENSAKTVAKNEASRHDFDR